MRKRTQLQRLQDVAKQHKPNADVTYTKQEGYYLVVGNNRWRLGKDSIEALFKLESIVVKK